VTAELDRLDLELRCIPGVVAVNLGGEDTDLLVQVVVVPTLSPPDVRERIRRTVQTNLRESVNLELVVDTSPPNH
jgi:multisubunit Na+/H+ antiporter MnhE subunit